MQFSLLLLSIQAQMTLKHAQAELKTKQAEMKKMDSGYKKDQDTLQAVKSTREKLQAEINTLNYEGTLLSQLPISLLYFCIDVYGLFADGKEESLLGKRRDLSREVTKLKEKYEHLVSRFPNLRFDYK